MRETTSNSNNNVESSFYEDNQFAAPPAASQATTMPNTGIKRPHSLDFTGTKLGKRKFNQSLQVAPVLDSPDIQKLGLATPDIEKFMLNNPTGILQTPGLNFTPNKVNYSQKVPCFLISQLLSELITTLVFSHYSSFVS